ncbi:MAG: pyridine nucleotide-disulfide oxidoreductase, partial [Bacillota bacterium]
DCATAYHLLYQDDAYIPLGTTANKQGKVAGENAAGGKAEFAGIVGTAIIKVLDLEIGRTGLSKREAQQLGREVQEIKVEAYTKAHFYPGSQAATIKLLIEKASQKIVGAQIVGGAGAGKRIDVLAVAVQLGLTPFALSELDLSYAPPFSPVWDPVLTVANVAVGELEKKA